MDMLNYLLLVNIYLVLFYVFYATLLKDETFFKLNRIYLVGGASMSFLIPFLQSEWIRSFFITKQVEAVTQNISLTLSNEAIIIPSKAQAYESGEIILFIYLAGVVFCLLRFLWQLYKIQAILKSKEADHAFSFFNNVKVGDAVPHRNTVYDHELVHARHWHSADVILFEMVSIINWFNPVVHLYRKAIKHIHEFTADEIASRQEESKSAYAVILLSKTFGIPTHQLTNSFYNQSLLKRRIIMLHKSKSTRNALLKYGLSAPLFAAMIILSSASFKSEKVAERISNVSSEALDLITNEDSSETDYQQFLKRNPTVKALEWRTFTQVYVIFKSGKKEIYQLNNPVELKKAEGLYGQFPSPPPPPPPTFEAHANVVSSEEPEGAVYSNVDNSPEFPGGMKAFFEYFAKTFKYTEEARAANVSGKLIMYFIVESDGRLTKIQVIGKLGSGLDEEAVKVLENSPRWTPGIKDGKAVSVYYTLPIFVRSPAQKTGSITIRNTKAQGLELSGVDPNALYIVDGKEVGSEAIKTIDPAAIRSVIVLKGAKAVAKYGERAKAGAVEIYINENPQNNKLLESRIGSRGSTHSTTSDTKIIGSSSGKKPGTVTFSASDSVTPTKDGDMILNGKNITIEASDFKGLTMVDGVEITKASLKKLDPKRIGSMNVLQGESAVEKYGDRGKEGAIEITLKKK